MTRPRLDVHILVLVKYPMKDLCFIFESTEYFFLKFFLLYSKCSYCFLLFLAFIEIFVCWKTN